jgi:hypothetical protein
MFSCGIALELTPQGRLPHGAIKMQGERVEPPGQNLGPLIVHGLGISGENLAGMPEPKQLSLSRRLLGDLVYEFADEVNKAPVNVGFAGVSSASARISSRRLLSAAVNLRPLRSDFAAVFGSVS